MLVRPDMLMLRWWFLAVAELAGMVAIFATGTAYKLWTVDVTKLSIACLVNLDYALPR